MQISLKILTNCDFVDISLVDSYTCVLYEVELHFVDLKMILCHLAICTVFNPQFISVITHLPALSLVNIKSANLFEEYTSTTNH